MKKKNFPTLFILLLTLSNLFTFTVQAEELDFSETVSEEYLFEQYATYDSQSELTSNHLDEAREKILWGLLSLEEEIIIESFNVSHDEIKDLYFGLINDHPEIFYTLGFSWRYNQNKIVTSVMPTYSDSKDRIEEKIIELDAQVDRILNEIIKPGMTDFEKEIAIHDYIVLNTQYDLENYHNETIPYDSYSVYGVLVNGIAVCQGYAESMKLLLNKVDVDCIVVSAPEIDHAWNIVTLDGVDYHVDATWNDPTPDREGYVSYQFLNLTDEQVKKTHRWDYDKYPACTSDKYSFLWEMTSPKFVGDTVYYASNKNLYLYTLDLNTLEKIQLTDVRAPFFDLAGDWIYFSNYSNGGYLHKVKTDGTNVTPLNKIQSENIYFHDGYIYYTEERTGVEQRIEVDVHQEPIRPDELIEKEPTIEAGYLDRFKNWVESFFIAPQDSWEIKFNLPLNQSSINHENVYVIVENGKIVTDFEIYANDEKTVIVTPKKEYPTGSYYLIIDNFESENGKVLAEGIKVEFTVE